MPIAIILQDDLYDIIVETDKPEKVEKLYNFARQLNPTNDEPISPWNQSIFKKNGELWLTSKSVVFNEESSFREKFPGRRVPMRLTIRHAEKTKWYHGLVYLGTRYFQERALSADKDLAPMSEFPSTIFSRPKKSSADEKVQQKEILDHYMCLVELRIARLK